MLKPARRRDLALGCLGLGLLVAGWAIVHAVFGPFVLPSLAATGASLLHILKTGEAARALWTTLLHAVGGASLGAGLGIVLGLAAGHVRSLGAVLRPPLTVLLGVPPIAWIVLALLWFGPGPFGPLFTVAIAAMPIIFMATWQGVGARDPHLAEMAAAFALSRRTRMLAIAAPELAVHLSPALSTSFAMSWKVALMAELLGDGSGMGGRLATARAFLDLPAVMAWIVLVAALVLVSDGLLFGGLRRWLAMRTGPSFESGHA